MRKFQSPEVPFVKTLDLKTLSTRYAIRKLNFDDVEMILSFCQSNKQYYACCGKSPCTELIRQDLQITPPGIPMEQKYYIGFFENRTLVAIMDLILGYPDSQSIFIGFFMMHIALQGVGIGSSIIAELLNALKDCGFQSCQLGIDQFNPQSNHFWRKNGFEVIREVAQEDGVILVAQKQL